MNLTPTRRALGTAALATMLATGLSAAARAEKWDMPLAYPASNYHSVMAAKFAELVKEKTGGKIEIVTHPNGSLFKGDEIFRAVRTGQAVLGERLISALGNEGAIFEIDSIPFLATSFPEAMRLYQVSKAETEKVLESKGTHLLYAIAWPPQGIYVKKKIESGADMKGVRFRAYNAATAKIAELLGAVPTKIEAAEVTQAFATGVVDSMISSGSTGYDSKIWESVKYWYDVQAWLPKNMVIINAATWNKLDAPTKKAIEEAAAETEKLGWAEAQKVSDYYASELKKNGMEILPPSPKLKSDLQAVGAKMIDEWKAKAGPSGAAVVDAFMKK